ncbi:MAG: polysaccharide biosynthesis C-terminal domain-containing protein [Bacteroidales bacterium]
MSQIKKLAGQTVIYGLSNMLGRFLNYLLVPLHTMVLGKFFYGNLTYIYSSTAILLVILTYGLETGFFRFASKKEENYSSVLGTSFYSIVFTTFLFFILSFVFKQQWANYFGLNNYRIVIYFILIISLDVLNAIPFAKLRIDERPVKFMIIKVVGIAVNIFLNLFYLYVCRKFYILGYDNFFANIYNPDLVLEYVLIANFISSAVTFIILIPEIIKVGLNFNFSLLKRILNYSYPILLIGLAGMLNDNIDKLLIPKLINDPNPVEQLGIYGANFKLSVLMVLFIQMYRYAAEPFFFKNAENADAKKLYGRIMTYFIIFGLLIFLGVNFYLDILKYFIDQEFWEGLKVVPILLFAKLLFGILFTLSIWYKVTDRTKFGILIAGTGAVITIVANVILIPRIGYYGSAWASLASYIVMLFISYYLSQKYYPIKYEFKKIGIYVAIALALFVVSHLDIFPNNTIYYFVVTLFLLGFTTFAFMNEKKSFKYED